MKLLRQTTWLGPDDRLTIEVRSPEPIGADAEVTVRLHDPVASREELAASGTVDPGPVRVELTIPAALARRPDGRIALDLATDAAGTVPIPEAGVYPLSIELADGDSLRRVVTPVVRVPPPDEADRPPLAVATVIPVGAKLSIQPTGTVRVGGRNLDRIIERVDALTAEPELPLTVVPVPETVQSLSQTEIGSRVLDDLVGALDGRQVLASTYVEIDEGAWLNEGLGSALEDQRRAGGDALVDALDEEADSTTVVLADPPTPGLLAELEARGARRVVIPGSSPTDGSDGPVSTRPLTVDTGTGTLAVLTADQALKARRGTAGDPVLHAHRLLADLAVIDGLAERPVPGPAPGVVLMLPARGTLPRGFSQVVLSGLADGPLEPVTLDGLGEATAGPVVEAAVLETRRPRRLPAYPGSLSLTRLTLSGFGSLAGATNPLVADLGRRTLASGSRRLPPRERHAYLSTVRNKIQEQTALVGAPPSQRVTLTSRDGDIPLTLTNDAGYPVTVRVSFDSDRLEFPDGDTLDVALEPGSTAISVPVKTRTTGSFPLTVQITSPDGVLVVASSRTTLRSTAVSGVGLALSIGAGLVLLVWWLRHFRRSRPTPT